MPFYLVSHTSLIEADNEDAAARQVRDKLRTQPARFTVKYDEETITTVELQGYGPVLQERPAQPNGHSDASESEEAAASPGEGRCQRTPPRVRLVLMVSSILAAGIAIGIVLHEALL